MWSLLPCLIHRCGGDWPPDCTMEWGNLPSIILSGVFRVVESTAWPLVCVARERTKKGFPASSRVPAQSNSRRLRSFLDHGTRFAFHLRVSDVGRVPCQTKGAKMKKLVLLLAALVFVAGGAATVYYFLSNLNSLVAGAIETHGSEVTDTQVAVSGVDISLREGRGSITGLRIASPDGFAARDAFSLGDITVDIDLGSIREDPIVIDEVRISAPVINAELTKAGSSNIDELRKRVQAHTSGSSDSGSGGAEKKIRIKKFVFEEGRVVVDASAIGIEKREISLPEIHMKNVGGSNGAAPDEIAKIIVTTVAKNVTSEIASSEIDHLIKKKLGNGSLTDKAANLFKKIGG